MLGQVLCAGFPASSALGALLLRPQTESAACADDDAALSAAIGYTFTCAAFRRRGQCDDLIDGGAVCGLSCGICSLSPAQCAATADAARTSDDFEAVLDHCPPSGEMCAAAADAARTADEFEAVLSHCPPTDEICTALATEVLALPVCYINAAMGTANTCPLPCAEALLPASARCTITSSGQEPSQTAATAFTVVLASTGRLSEQACQAAAVLALAAAPATVTVAGLRCHPNFEGEYNLQPVPVNGKPHWVLGSKHHLYWTPAMVMTGGQAWVIDTDTDPTVAIAMLTSLADAPPTGSAAWVESCSGSSGNSQLQLSPSQPAAGCAATLGALTPVLVEVCCRGPDGDGAAPGCGTEEGNDLPASCSADCNGHWAPFAEVCQEFAGTMAGSAAGRFFLGQCGGGGGGGGGSEHTQLVPLPPTSVELDAAYSDPRTCAGHAQWQDSAGHVCSNYLTCGRWVEPYAVDGISANEACCICGTCGCSEDSTTSARTRRAFPFSAASGTRYSLQVRRGAAGLQATQLFVLRPMTPTMSAQALGSGGGICDWDNVLALLDDAVATDKSLAWTAPATGTFCIGVEAVNDGGAGHAIVSVEAVGTAVGRASPVDSSGAAVPLAIDCDMTRCSFNYGGAPMLDGDGVGFEMLLQAAEGVAYALAVELLAGSPSAAEVHLKFYYPGSVAGAGGFPETLGGPLGDWIRTPAGHHSFAGINGCADDDRDCWSGFLVAVGTYGYHPGQSFGRSRWGTWAAPVAGAVLLRVAANCDLRFFADVEAEGCHISSSAYGCNNAADGTYNGGCTADLSLAVTAGAHFDTSNESATLGAEMFRPTTGAAVQIARVEISRAEIEQLAFQMFVPSPDFAEPPTLDQMLVPGTSASVLLATMFTSRQQAHLAIPRLIEPIEASELASEMFNPSGEQTTQMQPVCLGGSQIEECQQEAQCAVGMPTSSCVPEQVSDEQTIGINREEVEQMAAETFAKGAPTGLTAPPTLEQMLVPGSEASVLLATIFTTGQQPHLAFPTAIKHVNVSSGTGRRLQGSGGDGVQVTIRATAPTAEEANAVLQRIRADRNAQHLRPDVDESIGGHRLLTEGTPEADSGGGLRILLRATATTMEELGTVFQRIRASRNAYRLTSSVGESSGGN